MPLFETNERSSYASATDYRALDEAQWQEKMHSDNRILVLAPIDGTLPKKASGLVDPRIFTGENKLHAVRDPRFSSWTLKYERGAIPPALQQTFVSFDDLLRTTTEYFKNRNITIVNVEDSYT